MATQIDSPDGRTHKDEDRPSPDFVETDDRPKKETSDTLRPPGAARDGSAAHKPQPAQGAARR
ncbi:hypothetical protein [Xylophilus sp.]|uniref:hypothetical protein n=1 Tax=Xylophilus sp. TaxID=2653893 RepID=UPI0013BA5823|nr:hypothetical protein [Xylophilus sp.]KAF1043619.1 MAG: hypothetical protein GAK38_03880 [Xylophilus sp.]